MKEKFVSRSDLPKTGWFLVDVSDTYEAAFTCENCKFPNVRYVHELKHKQTGKTVQVGCVCAEHLTQALPHRDCVKKHLGVLQVADYAGPRRPALSTINHPRIGSPPRH